MDEADTFAMPIVDTLRLSLKYTFRISDVVPVALVIATSAYV